MLKVFFSNDSLTILYLNGNGKMKNKKFTLNENCFLVTGAKRAAIYNLGSGGVYSVDATAGNILEKCEQGLPLSKIICSKNGLNSNNILEYLTQLENKGLGKFLNAGEVVNKVSLEVPKPELLWLEITSKCNLKCIHCYANSNSLTSHKEKLTLKDWGRVLKEAFDEGWRKVQFIGGEPLLKKKVLFGLIKKAKKMGYEEVVIFSNGILLDEETIQKLARLKIEMSISFYDKDPKIHNRITQVEKSFAKTLKNLRRLKQIGVSTKISITVTKFNQENLFDTIEFLKRVTGIQTIQYDLVRPTGRGCNLEIFPDKIKRRRDGAIFPKVTYEKFCSRVHGHNCFSRFLCVTDAGEVIPCIMARDLILGNVLKRPLRSILQRFRTKNIQGLNKDKIQICKDCEYRYACFDCRPMARYYGGNLYAKPNECSYNPYLGIWENNK